MKRLIIGSIAFVALLIAAPSVHAQYGGGVSFGSIIPGGGVPNPLPSNQPNPSNASIVPPGFTGSGLTGSVLGASTHNFTVDLHLGSSGADVTALQEFLIDAGYSISAGATGYFGSQTKQAVIAYQRANSIAPAAGYIGPLTLARLNRGNVPTFIDETRDTLFISLISTIESIASQISLTSQEKLAAALGAVYSLVASLKTI